MPAAMSAAISRAAASQLLVKASFDRQHGLTRRITFPDAANVSYDDLRDRVAECFCINNFRIAYKDDDGDETVIESDADLSESIDYFQSDNEGSTHTRASTNGATKVVMRIFILLDYEGPGLSETGTFVSEKSRASRLSSQYRHRNQYRQTNNQFNNDDDQDSNDFYEGDASSRDASSQSSFTSDSAYRQRGPYAQERQNGFKSAGFSALPLRQDMLQNSGDGRHELEMRWFEQNSRLQPSRIVWNAGSQVDNESFYNGYARSQASTQASNRLSSISSSEMLEAISAFSALALTTLSREELLCSGCGQHLTDLRFICQACGPLRKSSIATDIDEALPKHHSPDGKQRKSSSSLDTIADPGADASAQPASPPESKGSVFEGFELCDSCIDKQGKAHLVAMSQTEGASLRAHVFVEAHRNVGQPGWRPVDYIDAVACNSCGRGPLHHGRFKCIICARFDLCRQCFDEREDIHPCHPFQAVPPVPLFEASPSSRGSGPSRSSGESVISRQNSYRSSGSRSSGGSLSSTGRSTLYGSVRHEGCLCSNCLNEIIGPRFHCATCNGFELCSNCEAVDPPVSSPDGMHSPRHILLKITIPLPSDAVSNASHQARSIANEYDFDRAPTPGPHRGGHHGWRGKKHHKHRWQDHGAGAWEVDHPKGPPGSWGQPHEGGPPPPPFYGGPPGPYMPPPPHFGGPHFGPPHHRPGPPPPNVFLINTSGPGGSSSTPTAQHIDAVELLKTLPLGDEYNRPREYHSAICRGCSRYIVGVRWLCANCPTMPSSDLCGDCEKAGPSNIHHPMHAFLRIVVPLVRPLPPMPSLLPIMYEVKKADSDKETVVSGKTSPSSIGSDENDTVEHEVKCHHCQESIVGTWMHCAICPESSDSCEACFKAGLYRHDPSHIFIKFTKNVSKETLQSLTGGGPAGPVRPLLPFMLY